MGRLFVATDVGIEFAFITAYEYSTFTLSNSVPLSQYFSVRRSNVMDNL